MAKLPEKTRQIAQVHAQLINSVVMACNNSALLGQLEPPLQAAQNNGWTELVKRIRSILGGSRDSQILVGLDEEDAAIILSILVGLQDPSQLPRAVEKSDATFAAPGLAAMIHAASNGDVQALSMLGTMAEQMAQQQSQSGTNKPDSMQQFAAVLKPLIDGERDLTKLSRNMDEHAKELMEGLLDELSKLESEN